MLAKLWHCLFSQSYNGVSPRKDMVVSGLAKLLWRLATHSYSGELFLNAILVYCLAKLLLCLASQMCILEKLQRCLASHYSVHNVQNGDPSGSPHPSPGI